MNCNPFTNGHEFLIKKSLTMCDMLYIFILEEDLSLFSFEDRFTLVKKCTEKYKNISILPSGKFIISSLTFSEYFNKDKYKNNGVIDTTNDLNIFCKFIAPALGIKIRFAGNEPFCEVTRQYNLDMKEILPRFNIKFEQIERLSISGVPISASNVRNLIDDKNFNAVKKLVPNIVFDFLIEKFAYNNNLK